ncbi:MAG: hypothetical protein ACPHZB_07445 [Flavobacteriales bacterium]
MKKIITVHTAIAEPAWNISVAGAGPVANQKNTLINKAAKIITPPMVGTARV